MKKRQSLEADNESYFCSHMWVKVKDSLTVTPQDPSVHPPSLLQNPSILTVPRDGLLLTVRALQVRLDGSEQHVSDFYEFMNRFGISVYGAHFERC